MAFKKQVNRAVLRKGDVIDQRYKIRKILGEGSFGAVYLVDDLMLHTPCALKIQRLWEVTDETRQKLRDRFRVEYETGRIHCDCLVNSLAHGEINGNPYIVMEYCPGNDLIPFVGKAGNRAVSICHDILIGLNALHTHGKVHRDLKPENVLFKSNGRAALTDFGIVGDRNNPMTQVDWKLRPKEIFGTHAYMAPEQRDQARGGITRLPTTDIFSFGVLTYQLLTGRLPFGRLETYDDLPAYKDRSENEKWDEAPLRYIDQGQLWSRLIEGCLRKDYTKRLQTAAAVDRLLLCVNDTRKDVKRPIMASYRPSTVTRGFRLRVLNGQEHGRIYDLNTERDGRRATLFTIGRHEDNDICVRSDYSDYLSRHHCTLEADRDAKQWRLLDGQWDFKLRERIPSRNGTYVNSSPVRQIGYYLKPGDIITLGDLTIRFENY